MLRRRQPAVISIMCHGEVFASIVPGRPAGVWTVNSVVARLAPIVENISRQRRNLGSGNPSIVVM